MTSHPNRGWCSRWVVGDREARHLPTGLIVRFVPHPDGGWDGKSPNAQEVFAALRAAGTQNLAQVAARLMREAGDIFSERNEER